MNNMADFSQITYIVEDKDKDVAGILHNSKTKIHSPTISEAQDMIGNCISKLKKKVEITEEKIMDVNKLFEDENFKHSIEMDYLDFYKQGISVYN